MRKFLFLVIAAVTATGCASNKAYFDAIDKRLEADRKAKAQWFGHDIYDPKMVSSNVRIQYDDFSKTTQYNGPEAVPHGMHEPVVRLVAINNQRTLKTSYIIHFVHNYRGDWRFFNNAVDADGNLLRVESLQRETLDCSVPKCTHLEIYVVEISRDYLQERSERGLHFRVVGTGRGAAQELKIPSGYVKGFLASVPQ
ncbi:hypothetical protein [Nitrogeniibacter aestuarii]|uniref:hypothetical protein n=1 Tax=Nitrogeniibacter aestuarii TaxID=2815343 RepID=UPI001D1010C3|nr:hypothetical protein [Nitrogeniibacter aestuarii]